MLTVWNVGQVPRMMQAFVALIPGLDNWKERAVISFWVAGAVTGLTN